MKIVDRVAEIELQMSELIKEARTLARKYEQGYRYTDEGDAPDNVVQFPAEKRKKKWWHLRSDGPDTA